MVNISYISLLQNIEAFASAHMQIKKFASDFVEQIPNFATQDEAYPVLFVAPTTTIFDEQLTTFTVDVFCFDVIQKDRANINTILSDTNLILSDFKKWFTEGDVLGIEVLQTSSLTPINNALLDYVAGWQMTITFEVESYTVCEIPFDGSPVITEFSNEIVYSQYLTCNNVTDCHIIQDIQSDIVNLEGMITGLTFNVLSGNVIYVDKLNGNNATGTINDFTKPFSTLSAALIFSESVPKTDTNKILIKVRPGEYNDEGQMYFIDNVDIYCEPGVYFTGKFQFDTTGAVKSNFYGYAVFNVTYVPTSANAHFRVSHPSYINIEFDKLYGITPALIALYTGTDNLINFKANYVYTKGFNSGFGMSLRSDCNANIDIKKYDSLYQLFSFVSLSGVVNVNIEEGNLLEGDPYTYNGFKSIFRFTSNGTIPGSVYATGNYFIKITTQPVSISSAVRFWAGGNTKFYFKGIMDCGLTHPGIFLTDGTNEMNFEGKLIGYRELITVGGACKFNMKNSDVKRLGNANVSPINLSSTAISHINNSNFYTERNGTFSSLFNNSRLYMNNVLVEAVSSATTQQFITVSSTANFGVSNSITNMTYNTSLTPLYLINFSVGPNINVTKI